MFEADGVRILACVDKSPQSNKIIHKIIRISDNTELEVSLIHVVDTTMMSDHTNYTSKMKNSIDEGMTTLPTIVSEAIEENEKFLNEKQAELRNKNIYTVVKIVAGDVSEKILESANMEDYDVIMLGRKGLGNSGIIGSVSKNICERSPCPVLLIP